MTAFQHLPHGTVAPGVSENELTEAERSAIASGELGYCRAHRCLWRRVALDRCVASFLKCQEHGVLGCRGDGIATYHDPLMEAPCDVIGINFPREPIDALDREACEGALSSVPPWCSASNGKGRLCTRKLGHPSDWHISADCGGQLPGGGQAIHARWVAAESAPEHCPCGRELHYPDPITRAAMEAANAVFGPTVEIELAGTGRRWRVPRHYLALHGVKAAELAELAARYSFEEAERLYRDTTDGQPITHSNLIALLANWAGLPPSAIEALDEAERIQMACNAGILKRRFVS